LLYALGLQPAAVSTQIAPPESTARFYHELVLLTGVLANLGDDVRKLVAPEYGEIVIGKAAASTSSTMAQKVSNPIAAEQLCGLHVNVLAEHQKVLLTLISDFQRDLRWSSVMRSYSAIMVYAFQQLKTCLRLLKNMSVNAEACQVNFQKSASLLTAEVMHLALQDRGYSSSHAMVNAVLVPKAREKNCSLGQAIDYIISNDEVSDSYNLGQSWKAVPADLKELIDHPENYLGFASEIACEEANNSL